MSLATERAKFLRFALSVSVVSQNATLPVAFSAPSYRCRLAVACITAILYHTRSVASLARAPPLISPHSNERPVPRIAPFVVNPPLTIQG